MHNSRNSRTFAAKIGQILPYACLKAMLNLLFDRHIPFLSSVLDAYNRKADADERIAFRAVEPEGIARGVVQDADALIIRTRTPIKADLLDGSNVRFIATATIGYDHIDTACCDRLGIRWTACPGCNAQAVCDYMEEVLRDASGIGDDKRCIGIVGVGHVGSLVATMACKNGYRVLLNDPYRMDHEGLGATGDAWVDLETLARESDIITFHTPLTYDGSYPTYHLCNSDFLARCKPSAWIINAARGGVVDEQALLSSGHTCVIDCWEGEPNTNPLLLNNAQCVGATCHIAGYSVEGKMNASRTCLTRLADFFQLPPIWDEQVAQTESRTLPRGDSRRGWIKRLTQTMKRGDVDFETLRKKYILR